MMQGAVGLWVLSALLCLGSGHHEEGHEGQDSAGQAASLATVTSANKAFTFNLYRQLAAQASNQGKNIFFSPSSVSLALAALSVGARGQTHQQIFSGMGFNSSLLSQQDVNQAFHGLLSKASSDSSSGTAVFVDNKFKPQAAFLEALRQSYMADGFNLDFANNPTESAAAINKYVGDKTNGKINQLVEDLDPATLMYLVTFIYYKGKWQTPFDPKDTRADVFHVDEQNQVPVQMMNMEDQFDVYIDQQVHTTVLRLPFNSSSSMLLMLPDAGTGLAELEEHICPMHLAKWLNWMKPRKYNLFIPKFSIKTKMNLNDVLRQMGITDVFGPAADLSGIAESIAVSEVVHQASLDVDESGATAAAATGVGFIPLSFQHVPELKFNRPFMVLIADSDNILFMGKILNPNL